MRLLERQPDGHFCLTRKFQNDTTPPYAILSHTWGDESQEVTYEDLLDGTGRKKDGYKKIRFCAEQAARDGLQYFWVDSCCIKKTSDSELSSSINAMFCWYQRAVRCYVYLADVSINKRKRGDNAAETWKQAFQESKWFTRGWTLQELLAPASVEFFSSDGKRLGDRVSLKEQLHEITGISLQALEGRSLDMFSVSERNSWAAKRVTTIEEDGAYCLLGIFDISMSSRYGEGKEKAFQRLYNKIKKKTTAVANNEQVDENRNVGRDTFDAILRWLASPDQSINYKNALKQRQVGTGLWFLRQKSYLEWIAGESYFLWLYGIPGCGKSILSSTVIEDLLEQADQCTGGAVVYFYFDFNDPQKRRADLMVRSILAQLLRKYAEIPEAVAALFSSCDSGRQEPPLSACVDVLRRLIIEMPRVFFVLDALDECDSRKELLEAITSISDWEANNLHVLLTSRKERDIQDTIVQIVKSENIVPLQSDQVDPDIRAYIIERLSKDKSLEKWQKNNKVDMEIESVLMEKAQGIYVLLYDDQYISDIRTGFDGPLASWTRSQSVATEHSFEGHSLHFHLHLMKHMKEYYVLFLRKMLSMHSDFFAG
jgi:Heterokaryon incompatibility protein (HET)/NACHT domain